MFRRAVPAIAPEAVAVVGLGEGAHRVVAEDLGHHARSSDRRAPGVGAGQALYFWAEVQIPVREAAPGAWPQGSESPAQGLAVRQPDPVTVDPPGRERHDGDGPRPTKQRTEDFLSDSGPQQFGVVDPGDLVVAEYYGRGHQRPGQRATPGLIGPRQRPAAAEDPGRIESVKRTLLGRLAPRASP